MPIWSAGALPKLTQAPALDPLTAVPPGVTVLPSQVPNEVNGRSNWATKNTGSATCWVAQNRPLVTDPVTMSVPTTFAWAATSARCGARARDRKLPCGGAGKVDGPQREQEEQA